MKIFLTNQYKKLDDHLTELKLCKVMPYDRQTLTNKISSIEVDRSLKYIDNGFFFNYSIFPSSILIYQTQWEAEQRAMQVGDTIVQQIFLPPMERFSQKIIFGVRISRIINEANRVGFSYETLDGHVERGESTFTLEEVKGKTVFRIQTFSEPGNWITKLLGSFFSIPYQAYCTQKALENVKRQIS